MPHTEIRKAKPPIPEDNLTSSQRKERDRIRSEVITRLTKEVRGETKRTTPPKFNNWVGQAAYDSRSNWNIRFNPYHYFYRAMSEDEFINLKKDGILYQTDGHQGFSPSRNYCLGYLNGKKYRYVVEFRVHMSFMEGMISNGYQPKAESGVLSYGIGSMFQNADRQRNQNLVHPWILFHNSEMSFKVVNLRLPST